MIRLQHVQHARKPEYINILSLQMLNQSIPRFSTRHLLHDAYEFLLELFLMRRFGYTHWSQFCHLRHVDIPSEDCIHEFNVYDVSAYGWEEVLFSNHEIVECLLIRQIRIDGVL